MEFVIYEKKKEETYFSSYFPRSMIDDVQREREIQSEITGSQSKVPLNWTKRKGTRRFKISIA